MGRFIFALNWGEAKSVPNDWVNKYMESWNHDDQQREADLRRAQFVSAGSLALFKSLWKQVEGDVAQFHDGGGDPRLIAQFIPSSALVVTRREFPMIELMVKVENGYITYKRLWKFDHPSFMEEVEGQFIITSDLQGRLQVKRNGEPFADHSELSQLLLTPVFEYIRKTR
jgi:hypothetical protein